MKGSISKVTTSLAVLTAAVLASTFAPSASATTLCPNQATVGGIPGTFSSSTVSGPLDGTCGTNSAVKIDIDHSTGYGKLQFQSGMPGFPVGLTLGGLSGASANVAFTSAGSDQPYFLLPFVDSSGSLGQSDPAHQIVLIEFQSTTLAGNTLGLDPGATLFNLYDNTTGVYLQGGQQDKKTLNDWLSAFAILGSTQLQGIWVAEGLTANDVGAESLTVNSLTITSTTPIPAALPLFASGLGVIGFAAARRRKRKAAA
jgi:hypothetical protein